jgi:hypothetical protein
MADPILSTACDFHGKCWDLLHAAHLRHGTDGSTSPPKEGMLRIFRPKNPKASARFEPANLGTRGQHANHKTTEAARCTCIYYPNVTAGGKRQSDGPRFGHPRAE